jgi:CubicO group peptidase (beta-lactamase class C family)
MNRRTFLRFVGGGTTLSLIPSPFEMIEALQKNTIEVGSLGRSTPESQGIDSAALLAFVKEAEKELDSLHSVMVARNGSVVAEGWWAPYGPEVNHWLFSLSKGFASTGVGIAISEGRLGLGDPVISFFPDETPKVPSENLKKMTVGDLLKMAHGHHGNADRSVMKWDDPDWVRNWLAFEVDHTPGTHWAYSNSVTYILSAIMQKVTGQRLVDYLQPRLFIPLGIEKSVWDESPEGISLGGSGLRLRTEDILRLGQLYLQGGMWNGTRLLPESWVAEATKVQEVSPPNDQMGYHFQVFQDQEAYGTGGLFGQNCFVIPNKNAVIATTAGVRHGEMKIIKDLVWKHILPAMGDLPLAENVSKATALADRLNGLSLRTVVGQSNSHTWNSVTGRRFMFSENDRGIESLTLESTPEKTVFSLVNSKGSHRIVCGHGEWIHGSIGFDPPALVSLGLAHKGSEVPCAACGAWEAEDSFVAKLCYTETPFMETFKLRFESGTVTLDQFANLSLRGWSARKRTQLVGKMM